MSEQTFVVTGTITGGAIVTLDETLPLQTTKVRVTIEPLANTTRRPYQEVMDEIRRRQQARGHQPPTAEEVEEYLRQERGSWE
jgi:hypothetical protein